MNGFHINHQAGQDLTENFYSMHLIDTIDKYPVMGTYQTK